MSVVTPIRITLTTFVDFLTASPRARHGVIKRSIRFLDDDADFAAKAYYLSLRHGVVAMFKSDDPSHLQRAVQTAHPGRKPNYLACQTGIMRWFRGRRRRIEWTGVDPRTWTHGGLEVRVTPELGLRIDGERYVIKLVFKDEEYDQTRVHTALRLLQICYPGMAVGLLHARTGKLYTPTKVTETVDALLHGEASSF